MVWKVKCSSLSNFMNKPFRFSHMMMLILASRTLWKPPVIKVTADYISRTEASLVWVQEVQNMFSQEGSKAWLGRLFYFRTHAVSPGLSFSPWCTRAGRWIWSPAFSHEFTVFTGRVCGLSQPCCAVDGSLFQVVSTTILHTYTMVNQLTSS